MRVTARMIWTPLRIASIAAEVSRAACADALYVWPVGRLDDLGDPRHVGRERRPELYRSTIGRISIPPPIRAAGIRAASWIAASRSSASKNR